MKNFATTLKPVAVASLLFIVSTGCETTDGGGGGSVYYGVGFYDPWYHGYYGDPDIIISTPPVRPQAPPRPVHPIAPTPSPRPTPMPSIPSTPRPAMRR